MKTKEQAAQEYADNISKDYPFNTSKEAQASLIKNDFLAGYNAAISVCEQEMNELRRKHAYNIERLTNKWKASEYETRTLHREEVKYFKDYIERILSEIAEAAPYVIKSEVSVIISKTLDDKL